MNTGKFFKWLGIGIASIFAIVVVALASLEFFVSDAYVARIVTKYAQQMLSAELKVEKIGFTAFSHFPSVGIKLTDGSIVSTTHLKDSVQYARTPAQADTLASFKEFTLLFNPVKLLSGRVDIHGIILDNPRAYAYVSPTGCSNWDIVIPTEDSLEVAPSATHQYLTFDVYREILCHGVACKAYIGSGLCLNVQNPFACSGYIQCVY